MNKIFISTEYIKLGQFLKFSGIVFTGSECKTFIDENSVKINGNEIKQRGKKLFPGDLIEIKKEKFLIERKK